MSASATRRPADGLDAVRPEIRALATYASPATEPASKAPITTKLDFNEAPRDVPDALKARVLARLAARPWRRYPERGNPRLAAALAASLGRAPEEVLVGNGSGELILAAVSVLAGSGGSLVLAPPTFSLYRQMAAVSGARLALVPRVGAALDVDEDAFLARSKEPGAVPLLCSPNNPTGGVVSRDFVRRLASAAPVVLVDQAYADFADPESDVLPLLDELPNLVVFRTLSKAFAAAGFRIGCAVARPALLAELEKGLLPYSVDHASEELGLALLEEPGVSSEMVAEIRVERARVAARLAELGAAPLPSEANFLFFAPANGDGRGLHARLSARGIAVRELDAAHPGHLRVSIGSREENDIFLAAVAEER